jgi:predicted methyltransferase
LKRSVKTIDFVQHNIINPLPEHYKGKYDFFYINPPYGSKNDGLSCILWLHRCMDLGTDNCSGCIIIPVCDSHPWTIPNLLNIQRFICANGFFIKEVITNIHEYDMDDKNLKSAAIIVQRNDFRKSPYSSTQFTKEMIKNLYGRPRKIPLYIEDDFSSRGRLNFSWAYGLDDFWK